MRCKAIRYGVVAAAVAGIVLGQDGGPKKPEPFQIRGVVEESGLERGLAGVQVTVELFEGRALSSATPRKLVASGSTDAGGRITFAVEASGTYLVRAQKEGYAASGSPLDGFLESAQFELGQETPAKDLRFRLGRPAEIAGQVIDGDSREPVPGLPVAAYNFGYRFGEPMLILAGGATTDAEGRFSFTGLRPGQYMVAIGSRMRNFLELRDRPELEALGVTDQVMTKFSESDRDKTDLDYDTSYWPGGGGFATASQMSVASGGKADFGVLLVRKVQKQRAVLSVAGSDCSQFETVGFSVQREGDRPGAASPIMGNMKCGMSAIVRGLAPGGYDLELRGSVRDKTKPMVTAYAKFQVDHGGATSISVPLPRGVVLEGRVSLADGAKEADLSALRVGLRPSGFGAIRHALIPVGKDQRFVVENAGGRAYRLWPTGVPESHYVASLRYNGIPVDGDEFAVNLSAPAQTLELVLDDKPAFIAGQVRDEQKPARDAQVWLAPWPQTVGADMAFAMRSAMSDASGSFSLAGLAPGTYRAVAVAHENRNWLHEPGVLSRALADAETITLERGKGRSVSLKLLKR